LKRELRLFGNRFCASAQKVVALGVLLAAPVACGGSNEATPAETNTLTSTQTQMPETATLATNMIDMDAALGRIPIEMIEIDPCPFLSDETAIAGVTTKFDFIRRSVANDECVWNYNIGFEINVRVSPLGDALPRADRTYNLEIPPVLQAQSGPGEDAVVFMDPTWDANAPRPYAFGFTLGDQDVMISTVGVQTSPSQLRSVANEIAARLPTAPVIEPQILQAKETYDPCQLWSASEVGAVFNIAPDAPNHQRAFGQTACIYGFNPVEGPGIDVQAGIFACEEDHIRVRTGQGFETHDGFGVPAVRKVSKEDWGTDISFEAKRPTYCINVVSLQNRDPIPASLEPGLETLMRNLLSRTPTE